MNKRKAISKRVRFEVFKRDAFSCQYCGAHPPGVLLHVDHILAVANGGTNDVDNLVTSCEPCNLGKGAVRLDVVPQSLSDKAKEAAEREAQLEGYQAILAGRRDRIDREVWQVLAHLAGVDRLETAPRQQYYSTQRFIERLGLHAVLESADAALRANIPNGRVFRYFCAVCWNKIREAE